MSGGSQSRLVLDDSGQPWILKFRYNPQGGNVVLNECLGTHVAECIGLSVPRFMLMSAHDLKISEINSPTLTAKSNFDQIHFASSFIGYSPFGKTLDSLPTADIKRMWNLREFAGVLALDLWLSNTDVRQAVFMQQGGSRRFKAYWIDFGYCFESKGISDNSYRASLYSNPACYDFIQSVSDFEPWLSAIEAMSIPKLTDFIHTMPVDWLLGNEDILKELILRLSETQKTLRIDIQRFVEARPETFINWNVDHQNLRRIG